MWIMSRKMKITDNIKFEFKSRHLMWH